MISTDQSPRDDIAEKEPRYRVTDSGCWEWLGAMNQGYAVIGVDKVFWRVTRLICTILFGRISKDEQVCHKCDNPSCIRPDHLFVGTQSDNMMDAVKKGRRSGPKRPKLTKEKAQLIRQEYALGFATHQSLAEKYDAHINTIGALLRGDTWSGPMGRPPLIRKLKPELATV